MFCGTSDIFYNRGPVDPPLPLPSTPTEFVNTDFRKKETVGIKISMCVSLISLISWFGGVLEQSSHMNIYILHYIVYCNTQILQQTTTQKICTYCVYCAICSFGPRVKTGEKVETSKRVIPKKIHLRTDPQGKCLLSRKGGEKNVFLIIIRVLEHLRGEGVNFPKQWGREGYFLK